MALDPTPTPNTTPPRLQILPSELATLTQTLQKQSRKQFFEATLNAFAPRTNLTKALSQLSTEFKIDLARIEDCRTGNGSFNEQELGQINEVFAKKIQERREAKSNILAGVMTKIQEQVSTLLPIATAILDKEAQKILDSRVQLEAPVVIDLHEYEVTVGGVNFRVPTAQSLNLYHSADGDIVMKLKNPNRS